MRNHRANAIVLGVNKTTRCAVSLTAECWSAIRENDERAWIIGSSSFSTLHPFVEAKKFTTANKSRRIILNKALKVDYEGRKQNYTCTTMLSPVDDEEVFLNTSTEAPALKIIGRGDDRLLISRKTLYTFHVDTCGALSFLRNFTWLGTFSFQLQPLRRRLSWGDVSSMETFQIFN